MTEARKALNDPQKRAIDVGDTVPEGVPVLDAVTVTELLVVSEGVMGGVCVAVSNGDPVVDDVAVGVCELEAFEGVPLGVPLSEAVTEKLAVVDDV